MGFVKNVLTTLAIISFGIFITFLVAAFLSFRDTTDFVVAKSLPHYPNSTTWHLKQGCGVGNYCSGGVSFKTTDSKESVFNFYRSELTKRGWAAHSNENGPYFTNTVAKYEFTIGISSENGSVQISVVNKYLGQTNKV